MPRPSAFDVFPNDLHPGYGPYAAIIDDWHDADTVKVLLDPGFDETPCRWLRLDGVHAPELSQEGGYEARDYAASLAPVFSPVAVATQKKKTVLGQYETLSRYGAKVTLPDGRDLNALVEAYCRERGFPVGM